MRPVNTMVHYSLGAIMLYLLGCTPQTTPVSELRHYPLDNVETIITKAGVTLDPEITTDGQGALRVSTSKPTTVRLYETGDLDVEAARLLYQAKLRLDGVDGQVYLEMWCHFPGKGEFFSRAVHASLSGSTDWATQETPFFLQAGQNPDNVKLNLVINGSGTVWMDDIRLVKGPLG